jgi:hypothetical protein
LVFGLPREDELMAFQIPQIATTAERLLKEVETAVRRFPRYHKYAIGNDLRSEARKCMKLANRAWRDPGARAYWLRRLAFTIDDLKATLQVGKTVEAFASFNQFEMLARIAADLGRQCGGWLKQQRRLNGQNGPTASPSAQRPETLSARAASSEANP